MLSVFGSNKCLFPFPDDPSELNGHPEDPDASDPAGAAKRQRSAGSAGGGAPVGLSPYGNSAADLYANAAMWATPGAAAASSISTSASPPKWPTAPVSIKEEKQVRKKYIDSLELFGKKCKKCIICFKNSLLAGLLRNLTYDPSVLETTIVD